jgi:hypothetical protein
MRSLLAVRRLLRNASGVAMVEFALGAPFLLMAGLWGTEIANYALINMKVGQLAAHVADNASRIGDTSTLQNRKIFEEDLNDLLLGANIQGGGINLYEHGRVIVTSVEIWDQSNHKSQAKPDGVQFAHWQRCKGSLVQDSEYANENQALPNGIGPENEEVEASVETPVIFVEVYYEYQPLISNRFVGNAMIRSTAAFPVRDSRDLEDVFKRNSSTPIADCDVYDTFPAT